MKFVSFYIISRVLVRFLLYLDIFLIQTFCQHSSSLNISARLEFISRQTRERGRSLETKMVQLCFVLDLRTLAPPLLGDLKQVHTASSLNLNLYSLRHRTISSFPIDSRFLIVRSCFHFSRYFNSLISTPFRVRLRLRINLLLSVIRSVCVM